MNKRILIVDDDPAAIMLMSQILSSLDYEVVTANNGNEGLQRYTVASFPVVITDLEMPVLDGIKMMSAIKEINADTVFIVVTVHNETKNIIHVMKMGVYDYLIKPITKDTLEMQVARAYEAADLRRIKKTLEHEKMKKIENQIAWAEYTEKLLKKDVQRLDKSLFENLHASFTMGAGLGAVLTLHKVIVSTAEKKGDKYIIDADIFEILDKNAKLAEDAIQVFSKISRIINEDVDFADMTVSELYALTKGIITELHPYTKIKTQRIIVNDPKPNFTTRRVNINVDYFRDAVKELLFNAMKFSIEHSTIMVFIETKNELLQLTIINNPCEVENGMRGIPLGYENLVFEPFFRMSKKISIGYDSLESGLGLSLVEKIIEKHGGKVAISNLKDHTSASSEPSERVAVSVGIPLRQRTQGAPH